MARRGRGTKGFRARIHGNPMSPARKPFDPTATLSGVGMRHPHASPDRGAPMRNPKSHVGHKKAAKLHGRRGRNYMRGGGR
jgi:hypothetical protein